MRGVQTALVLLIAVVSAGEIAAISLSCAVAAQTNSPAVQAYQELLKAGDVGVKTGVYACFPDDAQATTFTVITVISATPNKDRLYVGVSLFKDGVSDKNPLLFEGKVSPLSSSHMLFAELPTMISNPMPSHETDTFSWSPDTLGLRTGFGKVEGPQLRITYEFTMQRSTGRYVEDTVMHFPDGSKPIHATGRCLRVPGTATPEEQLGRSH
jgi:hypothetical protein